LQIKLLSRLETPENNTQSPSIVPHTNGYIGSTLHFARQLDLQPKRRRCENN